MSSTWDAAALFKLADVDQDGLASHDGKLYYKERNLNPNVALD